MKKYVSTTRLTLVSLLAMLLLLWGCGGDVTPTAAPTATSAPAATATIELRPTATVKPPEPTSTTAPRPTSTTPPRPTNTTAALATATSAALPTSTTGPNAQPTTDLSSLQMKAYTSTDWEFKVDYPSDWDVQEVPDTSAEASGQVQFLKPGTDGNVGLIYISRKNTTSVTTQQALDGAVGGITSNSEYTNIVTSTTTTRLGNAEVDSQHIEADWKGLHMLIDVAVLVQGERAYAGISVATDDTYNENIPQFLDSMASFEPTTAATGFDKYTSPNGGVSLLKPSDWTADESDPNYIIFNAPAGDALIIFNAVKQDAPLNDTDFQAYIDKFMADNFANQPGYKLNGSEPQTDGSTRVSFDITGPDSALWRGNGFFEQRGSVVVFSLFAANQDKWENYLETFNTVANSVTVDENAIGAPKTIVTEQYTDDKIAFSTLAPQGWEPQINDDGTIVFWTAPDSDASILIQVDDASGLDTTYFQDTANATDYVKGVYGDEPDYTVGNTEAQPDGSMRVGWTMTGINGNQWKGQAFLEVREYNGKNLLIAQFVSADIAAYEQYLPGFNDILNSLQLK